MAGRGIDRSWTVFVDRDGVINERLVGDYVREWCQFSFLPGAIQAMVELNPRAGPIVVLTNQAGVGKGLMPSSSIEEIHNKMVAAIADAGGRVDAVMCCPHRAEEACSCRKPATGLVCRAVEHIPAIDLSRSVIVGDSTSDLELARRLRIPSVLVTGTGGDHIRGVVGQLETPDLLSAARLLLNERGADPA